jgi:hypothetical protein
MISMSGYQRRRYLAHRGMQCLYCKSKAIEGGSVDIDAGGATQVVNCLDCERSWMDHYKLVDVEPCDEAMTG